MAQFSRLIPASVSFCYRWFPAVTGSCSERRNLSWRNIVSAPVSFVSVYRSLEGEKGDARGVMSWHFGEQQTPPSSSNLHWIRRLSCIVTHTHTQPTAPCRQCLCSSRQRPLTTSRCPSLSCREENTWFKGSNQKQRCSRSSLTVAIYLTAFHAFNLCVSVQDFPILKDLWGQSAQVTRKDGLL